MLARQVKQLNLKIIIEHLKNQQNEPKTTETCCFYVHNILVTYSLSVPYNVVILLHNLYSKHFDGSKDPPYQWALTDLFHIWVRCFCMLNAWLPRFSFITMLYYLTNFYSKYFEKTLDSTLSFKRHTENLVSKLRTRNNVFLKLAGTAWSLT